MEMTQDVMANSLVYWVQDLYRGGFLENGSKITMTSRGRRGSCVVWRRVVGQGGTGRIRQLAMELAQTRKGSPPAPSGPA
jgi:hypothetical protein